MTNFRGPEFGYESEAKNNYRHSVWDSMIAHSKKIMANDDSGVILIMPSKQGFEIDTLIGHGIPESRIVCVDESPALIASSKWRKKYKSIRGYGCKISEVGRRLAKDKKRVAAANLDFCNNFSSELIDETEAFIANTPKCDDFAFSVTVMRGRESTVSNKLMELVESKGFQRIDEKRLRCLFSIVCNQGSYDHFVLGQGLYTHNKAPMGWASILCCSPDGVIGKPLRDSYEKLEKLSSSALFDVVYEADDRIERADKLSLLRLANNNPDLLAKLARPKPDKDAAKYHLHLLTAFKKVYSVHKKAIMYDDLISKEIDNNNRIRSSLTPCSKYDPWRMLLNDISYKGGHERYLDYNKQSHYCLTISRFIEGMKKGA